MEVLVRAGYYSNRIKAGFWRMVHPKRHHAENVAKILPSFDENNIDERIQTLYQAIIESAKARHPNNPQSASLCNRLMFIANKLEIELTEPDPTRQLRV